MKKIFNTPAMQVKTFSKVSVLTASDLGTNAAEAANALANNAAIKNSNGTITELVLR